MAQLFLDCDGVLADFETGAQRVLGMPVDKFQRRYPTSEFWKRLAQAPDFYAMLPLLPDAQMLFDAVRHLHPTILTGLPMGRWAEPQKRRWAEEHFPGTPVITCFARNKHHHMTGPDILVDDRLNHRSAWEDAGGVFIQHINARASIAELAQHFLSVKLPA